MQEFFKHEPVIKWNKVFCPLCNGPTGEKSKCYELSPDKQNQKIIHKVYGILPTYSPSCVYRQDNMWVGHINYPFSYPLLNVISKIDGVEKIMPIKPYAFQISIGKAFDEKIIQRAINIAYKTFIKEMHVREQNVLKKPERVSVYTGINFPNGEKFLSNSLNEEEQKRQSLVFEDLIEKLPETEGIRGPDSVSNGDSDRLGK